MTSALLITVLISMHIIYWVCVKHKSSHWRRCHMYSLICIISIFANSTFPYLLLWYFASLSISIFIYDMYWFLLLIVYHYQFQYWFLQYDTQYTQYLPSCYYVICHTHSHNIVLFALKNGDKTCLESLLFCSHYNYAFSLVTFDIVQLETHTVVVVQIIAKQFQNLLFAVFAVFAHHFLWRICELPIP